MCAGIVRVRSGVADRAESRTIVGSNVAVFTDGAVGIAECGTRARWADLAARLVTQSNAASVTSGTVGRLGVRRNVTVFTDSAVGITECGTRASGANLALQSIC